MAPRRQLPLARRPRLWRACNGDFRYPVPGPETLEQHAADMLDDVRLGPDTP